MVMILFFLLIAVAIFSLIYFAILPHNRGNRPVVKWTKVDNPDALIKDAMRRFSEENGDYRIRSRGKRR